MRRAVAAVCLLLASVLGACSVIDHSPAAARFDKGAKWALLPIANHTETAQAGLRAEAVTEGHAVEASQGPEAVFDFEYSKFLPSMT